MDYNKEIETHYESLMAELKDHILEKVLDSNGFRAFYLRKPGTRIMSVLLTESPEGISIMGDLTPQINGSVSPYGYGLDWFAKNDYKHSCSRFLEDKYLQSKAEGHLKAIIIELRKEYAEFGNDEDHSGALTKEMARYYWNEVNAYAYCGDLIKDKFIEFMDELGVDVDLRYVSGYCPKESAILMAIQKRFSELYE